MNCTLFPKFILFLFLLAFVPKVYAIEINDTASGIAGLKKPMSVYITWASHDELSDTVPLTEELAMKELNALLKLKKQGVKFDYYIMDMFWFDKAGGFREFDKVSWPNGPDKWLKACKDKGIKPGLWLSTNIRGWSNDPWISLRPEWAESAGGWFNLSMSLHSGGFLKYHMETMQMWYDRGVRMFKFDFAGFNAATKITQPLYSNDEIVQRNEQAWFDALKQFRRKNPEVVLLAYNGYGGQANDTYPVFSKTVNLKWLEVFESLYCGDPRPADVPCHNFWRSKDIYSDHMVRQYEFNGVPLERIDNTAFMIGTTGTCYFRNKQAWKGMLILSAARGGWMNTYYGNLDLLNDQDGTWFAKVQSLFYDLQQYGHISSFGNIPGTAEPYGFIAENTKGGLVTIINPSQETQKIALPLPGFRRRKLLFSDNGFRPEIKNDSITLGPEQMALVGLGQYARSEYYLGVQEDVTIPLSIHPVQYELSSAAKGQVKVHIHYAGKNDLRIIFKQRTQDGHPYRITGGAPPDGEFMNKLLAIKAFQNKEEISFVLHYDKQIWSGLSWAVGEIQNVNIKKDIPLVIEYKVTDPDSKDFIIDCQVYEVEY